MKKEKSDLGMVSDAILSESFIPRRLLSGLEFIHHDFVARLVQACAEHLLEDEYVIESHSEALTILPCGCEYYVYRREVR